MPSGYPTAATASDAHESVLGIARPGSVPAVLFLGY
jgi:hypothetical protein